MVAFMGGYLVVMRKELDPKRAWPLLPLAVIVVWFANVGRLATLTWIGARISPEWAAGAFHSKAGWLLFCTIALSMVWLTQRVAGRERSPETPASQPAADVNPQQAPEKPASTADFDATDLPPDTALPQATTYYLAPLVATTAVALVTGVFFEPLDRLYGLRALVALGVLSAIGYRFRGLAAGMNVYSLGLGLLTFGLWWWFSVEPSDEAVTRFASQFADLAPLERNAWVVMRVVGSVLTVPICEELAFRGFLMRRVAARQFVALRYQDVSWLAIGVSSALFAVLHGSWLAGAIAGLLYAGLMRWRGKLAEVTVAHMVTNLCVAIQGLAGSDVPYWN
jgi:CAAX prenyl protease-like protein